MYIGNVMFEYYDGRIHCGNISFSLPEEMVIFGSDKNPLKEILIGLPDADWRIALTCEKYDDRSKQFCKQDYTQRISLNTVDGLSIYYTDDDIQCCEYRFDFQCDWGDNVFVTIIKTDSKRTGIEAVLNNTSVVEFFSSIKRN